SIGDVKTTLDPDAMDLTQIETNNVRCPDRETAKKMEELILSIKSKGDTVGGIVECVVAGLPAGIGSPVFDKLNSRLASAMMSINAAKGFEIGDGFEGSKHCGSEMNDLWHKDNDDPRGIRTGTNHSGGIQGGISNGEPVVFRVAFKPVATLLQAISTVDRDGNPTELKARGRHDPCVVPRAVPIIESMAALVIMDEVLIARAYGIL
ncbi:MAG: chorismate synthase, partial [Muribaculaceae bacterium]|nr:chorismate synthase [Muribaculaceae bacterium]